MIVGILQPSYLPWLGYFEQIHQSDIFVLYDDVQFEKGSWRNRNRIKTPQGSQWLTVPVLQRKRGRQRISEVEINPTNWQSKHQKALELNYRNSPFFEQYAPSLFALLQQEWLLLVDLNVALIKWFNQQLGITTKMILSSSLDIQGRSNERLIAIIKHLGGDTFYEGAAGKNYIDEKMFANCGITVRYQNYTHPVHAQLYGEFLSHLSAIDLLFNHGAESLRILTRRGGL